MIDWGYKLNNASYLNEKRAYQLRHKATGFVYIYIPQTASRDGYGIIYGDYSRKIPGMNTQYVSFRMFRQTIDPDEWEIYEIGSGGDPLTNLVLPPGKKE